MTNDQALADTSDYFQLETATDFGFDAVYCFRLIKSCIPRPSVICNLIDCSAIQGLFVG
jgi:hypothetical protein